MPWATNSELPDHIRGVLPEAAQTRFRMTANSALDRGAEESRAIRQAWHVVAQGWRKGENGKWERKNHTETGRNPYHSDKGHFTGSPTYRKAAKISQEEANYRGGEGDRRCDNCTMFRPPSECTAITGAVAADMLCDLFEAKEMEKAKPRTLYIRRDVQNGKDLVAWAKKQGFNTTTPADELHCTICYSKQPVDWMAMGNDGGWTTGPDGKNEIHVSEGGPRLVEPMGDQGAVALLFQHEALKYRNEDLRRKGASWDYKAYQPHITITWDKGDLDLSTVEPYTGRIILGPEVFEEIDEGWQDNHVEKALLDMHNQEHEGMIDFTVAKVDRSLGLVFGWAIVCKKDGEDYYDLNRDKDGERVPEHIPESTMIEAATDFMENSRISKEMHAGDAKGTVVFAFPLTTDIAKAMGISTKVTGLMIAVKPEKAMLDKFYNKELTGFSIGGSRLKSREVEHA